MYAIEILKNKRVILSISRTLKKFSLRTEWWHWKLNKASLYCKPERDISASIKYEPNPDGHPSPAEHYFIFFFKQPQAPLSHWRSELKKKKKFLAIRKTDARQDPKEENPANSRLPPGKLINARASKPRHTQPRASIDSRLILLTVSLSTTHLHILARG